MRTPIDLMPKSEMTVLQYQSWYRLLQRDRRINQVNIPYDVVPGQTVKMTFTQWNDVFYIYILPDPDNWNTFDDLRVEWEKDARIPA